MARGRGQLGLAQSLFDAAALGLVHYQIDGNIRLK